MKIRALKDYRHSVGTVPAGDVFNIDDVTAQGLIKEGLAALPDERLIFPSLHWPCSTVVIIASGPSLLAEDCEVIRKWQNGVDRRVIVINTSYILAPWADVLYGCDYRWWEVYHRDASLVFQGQLWSQDEMAVKKYRDIRYVKSEPGPGLNTKVGFVNQGANGGYQAIGLAYQAGAIRIVLLGFDMSDAPDGKLHWHADYKGALHCYPPYATWLDNFARMARDLKAKDIEVLNATRRTALTCFTKATLESALETCSMPD